MICTDQDQPRLSIKTEELIVHRQRAIRIGQVSFRDHTARHIVIWPLPPGDGVILFKTLFQSLLRGNHIKT